MDEGNFEYKNRRSGEKTPVAMDTIVEFVQSQMSK
jgi:prolyl-tRNA synthetase